MRKAFSKYGNLVFLFVFLPKSKFFIKITKIYLPTNFITTRSTANFKITHYLFSVMKKVFSLVKLHFGLKYFSFNFYYFAKKLQFFHVNHYIVHMRFNN